MERPGPLLDVNLSAGYPGRPGVLREVRFTIDPGEVVGLVGESGSGKSTVALAIMRLLEFKGGAARGWVRLQGSDLMAASEPQMRAIRGKRIGLVLQSPLSSLNPAMHIGDQLFEAWHAHRQGYPNRYSVPDMLDLLELVSLPEAAPLLKRYPRQLSLGQAQRVLIAMAILHRPALLIADEPTSALDAITQSEILNLFSRLSRQLRMGILYISHDLPSVASVCSRVAILRRGEVVEFDAARRIFAAPQHPYTAALVRAIPRIPATLDREWPGARDKLSPIPCGAATGCTGQALQIAATPSKQAC